jgi:hypothetical protein
VRFYSELRPSPGLAPWIECFWSIRAGPGPSTLNRVLPDGCSDLIVGVEGSPSATIVGTMRTALVTPLAGSAKLFGVRFHPGAALRIFDTPLTELTDRRIPLESLWARPPMSCPRRWPKPPDQPDPGGPSASWLLA